MGLTAQLARIRGLSVEKIGRGLSQALLATASEIVADASVSITNGAKTGKVRTGVIKKRHQASAPGEAPADDGGDLKRGLEAILLSPLKAQASSNAPYSRMLEDGTSRMAPRPFWRVAILKNKDTLRDNVAAVVRKAINNA